MSAKSTLVQLILNATAAGKSMLLAANAAAQKVLLSLGNVDNTSDANKPVSTAQQTALNAKVTGPASATDNAIVRFDTTTGKLCQSGAVTIDDSGNVAGVAAVTVSGSYGFSGNTSTLSGSSSNRIFLNTPFGAPSIIFSNPQMQLRGGYMIGWSDPSFSINADVALSRPSAGLVEINSGTAGTLRDLSCRAVTLAGAHNLAPIAKAALLLLTPTAASAGRWRVTDATPASREAYPDGTNWRYTSDDTVVS